MTDTFDPTKPCRTRDGREVRILCTDAPGPKPIVGYIVDMGTAMISEWRQYGSYNLGDIPHPYDLINAPERVTRCVRVDGPDAISSIGGYLLGKQYIELTFEDGKLIETKIHEA